MTHSRSSGVLMHPTSLPGPYGIGDLGPNAYRFVDFLALGGQMVWQVLPLGPTSYGDSPYQCLSAFAGNPLLVSPEQLIDDGLLPQEALEDYPKLPENTVDFEHVITAKKALLEKSLIHFDAFASGAKRNAFERFHRAKLHEGWLPDFALFMALKDYHGGKRWDDWAPELRDRKPDALAHARKILAEKIRLQEYVQFLFFAQWGALRQHAVQNGIRLMGDIPIFVAFDSADVWANRELFQLGPEGKPLAVAGVPPDYFSETGQLWGNPLYDWKKHDDTKYAWWIDRVRVALGTVDLIRLDHFRGFESYWAVPATEKTAIKGKWEPGPGPRLFDAIRNALGALPIVAEDLGLITQPVEDLRDRFAFPGMAVLQFAFDGKTSNEFLPHQHKKRQVVYTGTHDNDTSAGWYKATADSDRKQVAQYSGEAVTDPAWTMIRLALGSVADMALMPMQDLLSLGTEARMNLPGRASGNWAWRFRHDQLTGELAERLRVLTETYGRT